PTLVASARAPPLAFRSEERRERERSQAQPKTLSFRTEKIEQFNFLRVFHNWVQN
ncbi:hypothetical protein Ancab_016364, partial [Ancistrocladus abbreviatus]